MTTPPGLYDSHAHLADDRLYPMAGAVLAGFRQVGGVGVLAVTARIADWERVAGLAQKEGVWGAVGVHPLYREGWDAATGPRRLAGLLAANPDLRAVGEIGLDFHLGRGDLEEQLALFRSQLAVAVAGDYPVAFHNRQSWREFFAVLGEQPRPVRGVCHNFTGSRELTREILDHGLLLSFGGPLTWPDARRVRESARYAPLDRILVETDAPDLPPWPCRAATSAPADVARVLAALAELRGLAVPELAERVAANFTALFLSPRNVQGIAPTA